MAVATSITPLLADEPAGSGEPVLQMEPFHVRAVLASMKVEIAYLEPVYARRLRVIRVREVRPKSTAERAGLTVGMEIVSIEGVEIHGLSEDDFDRLMRKPLGRMLTLGVTKPSRSFTGRPFKLRIPLPDLSPSTIRADPK